MPRKLGILLATGIGAEDAGTVLRLSTAALDAGVEVQLFLMYDGVVHAGDPRFQALRARGARLSLCTLSLDQRRLPCPPDLLLGGQPDVARMAAECDRFLSFT
ncbi:MAG: DsrE family protein [Planctomycetes bacterium]|nr:DsrE family protein [Planctomycetota bacterium]